VLTVDARLELFKKQFPKEIIKVVQEREGQDHSILEINHTWMCKSSKTQEGIALLEREFNLLQMLQGKISTRIPVPLHYEENFLVYAKIPGSPLIAYTFYRLGNKQKMKLVFEVAQFLSQLHAALTSEQIASLHLTQTDWPWSPEKLQSHRHYLEDQQELLGVFDNLMKIYHDVRALAFEQKLIHNDLNFRNIIIDPMNGQLRGIIDFTDIAFDDTAFDLRLRRENPIDFVKPLGLAYAAMNKTKHSDDKMYSYYFATEFSRYFKYKQDFRKIN